MSKEAFDAHRVRHKGPVLKAFQWNGNGSVPDLRGFLGGLKVRILVDQDDLSLWLKWDREWYQSPVGYWLVHNPEVVGEKAISYYKDDEEFFARFEYVEPLELKR